MDNKKYLTEENYEKGEKKIKNIALIILIVGILLGGSLIATGIIKTNFSKKETLKINEERYNAAYKESEAKLAAANKRLVEITAEKETLNKQYDSKEQECDSLDMRADDWYAKVNQCGREAANIKSKINELSFEESKLKDENFTVYYDIAVAKNYNFLSVIAGVIILVSCIISFSVYMISKRREITAFTVQQVMPVAQESMEAIAPTVTKVGKEMLKEMAPLYGEVAKEISKGIKEGMNDRKE